ncbi:YciI family protein [Mycobacterium sp. MYCO198283]|uniref:YciI family protein n=1 Tax=Mycobacterium sp. MYCO198283 TaxID=2883505 RepID=UPI001E44CE4E|nr:YciI family protein [Mycobacterium sp. MYCO198283]MCG5431921.1 YciI family protein [Mycobacterium sp. MYCO198283]
MYYFALLLGPESTEQPDADTGAAVFAAYEKFHAKAGAAILAGDALTGSQEAVRISGGPDAPVVTDGPFAESAEIANGFYVIEADDLDGALALARDIPACRSGAVEVWPMVEWNTPSRPLGADTWLALLLEPPERPLRPGTPEWDEGVARHIAFGAAAGDRLSGGAALHPPSTATTVRVRNDELVLTDGPFVEGAEVANGFYLISAADRDEAVKVASMIPATTVELRRLAGISGL